jgi:head-tail adaptor
MDSTRLAHYRERAEAALPDTLGVVRSTSESDGGLGYTEVWATVEVDVPCRVLELGEGRADREAELAGMIRAEGSHVVRVPLGTDVTASDRLIWNGRTLEVSKPLNRSLATVQSLVCMEVG